LPAANLVHADGLNFTRFVPAKSSCVLFAGIFKTNLQKMIGQLATPGKVYLQS
jgi:hypothetical protein